MTNQEIAQEINNRIGNSPVPFDSVYSIALEIYQELGGEESQFDSVYSILLETLNVIDSGISAKVIDDSSISLTKTWSSSKIASELADAGFDVEIVTELPSVGDPHTIYFILKQDSSTGDVYDEWMYIDGNWEMVGNTQINLSDYATINYVDSQIETLIGNANSDIEGKETEDFTFVQTLPVSGEEDQLVIIKGDNTDALYKYVSGEWVEQTPDANILYFDVENEALYSYVTAQHQFAPISLVNTIIVGSNLNNNADLKALKTPGVYSVVQRLHNATKGDYVKNWTLYVESVDYEEYDKSDSVYQRLVSNYTIQKRTWSATRATNDGWSSFSTYYAGEIKDSTVSKYYTWSSNKLNALFADINAITDVDVLPNADENRKNFVRLSSDKKVYYVKEKEINAVKFISSDNSTIGLERINSAHTMEYSMNGINWNIFNTETTITLNPNESVYVRGKYASTPVIDDWTQFRMSGSIKAMGNINTLFDYTANDLGEGFVQGNYYGYALFSGCASLKDISELYLPSMTLAQECYANMFDECTEITSMPILPATTMASGCYYGLFNGCTKLAHTVDVLPATTLADYCYQNMFQGCSSLTSAPKLPATTLANGCYNYMFKNCTGLTTAPELPASILIDNCYHSMFRGCSSLNYIKCLATDISATNCAKYWLTGTNANGTFVKASSMDSWPSGASGGIPAGWTVENDDTYVAPVVEGEYSWNGAYNTVWVEIPELIAGQNISIDASNNISADGYVFDTSNGSFVEKYKQDNSDGGQIVANTATGLGSHAEGYKTTASGDYGSHAEGTNSTASGYVAHAEGNSTESSGTASHAEGSHTTASGKGAHAEGSQTIASGNNAHAEGICTVASGYFSHAEGQGGDFKNTASGKGSHVEGNFNIAQNFGEHAEGAANISHRTENDDENNFGNAGNTIHSIGIGRYTNTRKNAVEVMQNADVYIKGVGGYDGIHIKTETGYENTKTLQEYIAALEDKNDYLSFKNVGNSTVYLVFKSTTNEYPVASGSYTVFQFSKDKLNWTDFTSDSVELAENEIVYFRGKYASFTKIIAFKVYDDSGLTTATTTGCLNADGDIMTLVDYEGANTVPEQAFYQMFKQCYALLTCPKMSAKTIGVNGCRDMFHTCSNITQPLELPALNLSSGSYYQMFRGCTGLIKAPVLPATTVSRSGYSGMFWGCTGLTVAPDLPATTVYFDGYGSMFNGCTNLVVPPAELPATDVGYSAYRQMFKGCTSLTYSPVIRMTSTDIDWKVENIGEDYYWVSNNTNQGCRCLSMFEGCSSLKLVRSNIKKITNVALTNQKNTENWLKNVSATGTIYIPAGSSSQYTSGVDGIPTGWTVVEV